MKKFFALPDKTRRIVIAVLLLAFLLSCLLSIVTQNYVFENRDYTSKKDVALYLYTYKHLPYNYVTKSQVKNSGYQPSSGQYIGGDRFYYSGAIIKHTQNRDLRECDISYPTNTTKRGVKRLVFTADCSEVFYTRNHYTTFVKITKWQLNATSNMYSFVFGICFATWAVLIVYVYTKDGKQYKVVLANDLKYVCNIIKHKAKKILAKITLSTKRTLS